MENALPFHKRSLASFADDTITSARPSHDGRGWYAILDVGPQRLVGDPDFTRYAATEADARTLCAKAIRDDAAGIGKFAPHKLWNLEFRVQGYWAEKERRSRQPAQPEPEPDAPANACRL